MERAVFLDRDDTVIEAGGQEIKQPEQVRLVQGAASAIASLRGLGYRIVVVSNQTGVGNGRLTEAEVDAVNARIAELVQQGNSGASIDRFYYCPYHPQARLEQYRAEHPWRKPSPGMLKQAAADLDLDLAACWMVGDHARDVAAGQAAGTRTILLAPTPPTSRDREGAVPSTSEPPTDPPPDYTAASLVEAVRLIAQRPDVDAAPPAEPPAEAAADASPTEATPPSEPAIADADPPGDTAVVNNENNEAEGDPSPQAPAHDRVAGRPEAPSALELERQAEPDDAAPAPPAAPEATAHLPPRPDSPGDEEPADADAPIEPDHRPAPAQATADAAAPPRPEPRPSPRQEATAPADAEDNGPDRSGAGSGIPSPHYDEAVGSATHPHPPGSGSTQQATFDVIDRSPDASAGIAPASLDPAAGPAARSQKFASASAPGSTPHAPPRNAPRHSPGPPHSTDDPALADVLRSLQRELKSRRADYGDFSYAKMAAALCQMLAIGCVLFAMIHVGEFETFVQWILGAGLSQLGVITLLLIHGQK